MIEGLAVILAALFGAADQYLGAFPTHPWMTQISLLSAPWLVLPFLAGSTQRSAVRAALLGLACTYAALLGYGLMTLSPIENAQLTTATVAGFIRSESMVFVGGLLSGPVFGWLGHAWRCRSAWPAALATAAVLCFEPLARTANGSPITSSAIVIAEIAVGGAIAAYVVAQAARRPRASR